MSRNAALGVRKTQKGVILLERALIAIVDDDRAFRDSMRRLIKSWGYAVAVFASAAELLVSPDLGNAACLVADVQMPAMTGIQLYKHLVQTGCAIPTILITAYPDQGDQERLLTLGVECYLRKPLDPADLIRCLRSALAQGKARRDRS
jgi:FixJ family two-component response regulator